MRQPQVVAAAAATGGVNGTDWRTRLAVFNPGSAGAEYRLELWRGDGSAVTSGPFALAPGAAVAYEDAVRSVFGVDGVGALVVIPTSGALAAWSRTHTGVGAASYGQAIPALPLSAATADALLVGVPIGFASHRVNVGVVNPGDEEVTVTFAPAAGRPYGIPSPVSVTVPPRSQRQLNAPFEFLGVGRFAVRVEGGAPVFAYASIVDQATGDAVYVPAEPPPAE